MPSTCNPRIFSIPPASGQRSLGSHLLPTLLLPNSKSVMHAGTRQNSMLAFTTLNQRTSHLLAFVICDGLKTHNSAMGSVSPYEQRHDPCFDALAAV
jgi:hypothetical protein